MNASDPPPEAHRYGRSQTPESPRPLHIPEPSNIPVLQNQMDPVFNDTSTYDIPADSQTLSAIPDINHAFEPSFSKQNISDLLARVGQYSASAQESQRVESEVAQIAPNNKPAENEDASHLSCEPSISSAITFQSLNPGIYASHPAAPTILSPSNTPVTTYLENASATAPGNVLASIAKPTSNASNPLTENESSPDWMGSTLSHDADSDSIQRENQPSPSMGVNYQSLLDTLSQSNATAPAAENPTAPTTAGTSQALGVLSTGSEKPLPTIPGLPPRPPPQEKPAIHPNYPTNESIRSYHQLPSPNSDPSPFSSQHPSYRQDVAMPPVNVAPVPPASFRAANGLPPPPTLPTLQQASPSATSAQIPTSQINREGDNVNSPSLRSGTQAPDDDDRPWGPDIQAKYDEFLHDERVYVTEGVWDRFPTGSRLFVGNLPTEKVTKRDLFHIFHRHGKLAQISIKQAYGFVQFLEAAACHQALEVEQGVAIRGRKIHLEVSKPQKNTRNSGGAEKGAASRRRSRSPERRGASRTDRGVNNDRLPFSDFRDEPARRRDDYRPVRSPSPRGYRSRDDYRPRERSPLDQKRWDARPRSPQFGRNGNSFRPPSPRGFDEDAALPLPRRDPRDVPDVQILILEEVAQDFLNYVEQGFRSKTLRAQTIWLNPRITLAAVVKRQIIEGVQAVVKLTRNSQYSGKIPLQVFDRAAGATNVNFNEYVELDVQIAADIVISARQKERLATPVVSPTSYPPSQGYSALPQQYSYTQSQPVPHQYQQPTPQPYVSNSVQVHPSYPPQSEQAYRGALNQVQAPTPGAPNLQELLANLRQPSSTSTAVPLHAPMSTPIAPPTDLAGLLSNVARQQTQAQGYNQPTHPQQSLNQYQNRGPLQTYPSPAGANQYGASVQPPPQQNVQDIMEQLARWNK